MDKKLGTIYRIKLVTLPLTLLKLGVLGNFKNLYPFHRLRPIIQIFYHLKDHQGVVDGYQLFLLHLSRAFCLVMAPNKSMVAPVFSGSYHDASGVCVNDNLRF